jgi:hypothetical protein
LADVRPLEAGRRHDPDVFKALNVDIATLPPRTARARRKRLASFDALLGYNPTGKRIYKHDRRESSVELD